MDEGSQFINNETRNLLVRFMRSACEVYEHTVNKIDEICGVNQVLEGEFCEVMYTSQD